MESRHKRLVLKKMSPFLFHFSEHVGKSCNCWHFGGSSWEVQHSVVLLCYCHINIYTVCLCKCVVKMKAFVLNQSCFVLKVKEDFWHVFCKAIEVCVLEAKQWKNGGMVCHRHEEAVCTIHTKAWEWIESLLSVSSWPPKPHLTLKIKCGTN